MLRNYRFEPNRSLLNAFMLGLQCNYRMRFYQTCKEFGFYQTCEAAGVSRPSCWYQPVCLKVVETRKMINPIQILGFYPSPQCELALAKDDDCMFVRDLANASYMASPCRSARVGSAQGSLRRTGWPHWILGHFPKLSFSWSIHSPFSDPAQLPWKRLVPLKRLCNRQFLGKLKD